RNRTLRSESLFNFPQHWPASETEVEIESWYLAGEQILCSTCVTQSGNSDWGIDVIEGFAGRLAVKHQVDRLDTIWEIGPHNNNVAIGKFPFCGRRKLLPVFVQH